MVVLSLWLGKMAILSELELVELYVLGDVLWKRAGADLYADESVCTGKRGGRRR
jgi:hypothetical protein